MRFLAALAIAATVSAPAAAVTLDFDSYANGTILAGNTFAPQGVTFDQTLQIFAYDMPGRSGPNTVLNNDQFGGSLSGSFVGAYLNAVNFISVLAGDGCCDTDTVTLNAYDFQNILLATATFTGESSQTLSVSATGIARFELIQSGAVAYDNFTFTADEQVPEPAMLGLFGLGSLGLGLARRRRA